MNNFNCSAELRDSPSVLDLSNKFDIKRYQHCIIFISLQDGSLIKASDNGLIIDFRFNSTTKI